VAPAVECHTPYVTNREGIGDSQPSGGPLTTNPVALNPALVKETFAHIEPVADKAMAYFYGRLFAANPRLRGLFPMPMDRQRDRFFKALTRIVWSLDCPQTLASFLEQLGRDHRRFGVHAGHYAEFSAALLATVREYGPPWTDEMTAAWQAVLDLVAATMIAAADADARHTPSWWLAEVVGHQRRLADLAVITLRPDQPFGYLPGQYLTVQSARWPRQWRSYSIANSPRDDGTLTLHVRAIPGGMVSNALVHHTVPGDTVLLGPAAGTMTVPAGSAADVLCVAGGTGLAPTKAIIEQVTGQPGACVTLMFGARTEAGLYDLPDLRGLEAACPRLRVITVVSHEAGFDGVRGTLPDVVRQRAAGRDSDVYVCGPAAMVTATRAALAELGVPGERVRYDEPEPHWARVPRCDSQPQAVGP
jgi:NAD(P)H-flavin reductase/hemoglobin-like flavoprotein